MIKFSFNKQKSIDRILQSDTILVMKKKEITLEHIAEKLNVLNSMATDIHILKTDMSELRTDVKILREDVSVLKEDVEVLKIDVSGLKTDVSKLKEDVNLIRLDISQLRKDVDHIDENLLDTQDDIRIILELAKGNDGRLGYFQIATPH